MDLSRHGERPVIGYKKIRATIRRYFRKKGISGGEVAKRQTWREIMRINRKLLPMKFFLLLFYGGFSSLYPYLAIHIKSIGITVKQTGLIFTIYPICNCLGGPLAGIIGDKTGKYKLTLISMILLSIVLHLCILFAVPSYRITEPSFNRTFSSVEMHAECNATSILIRALPTAVIDSPPDVHDVSCSSTSSLLLHPFPLSSWNRTNCKFDCEDKSKCTTDHESCSRIFSLALDAVARSADDPSIPFSWPCWPENASTSGWKGCTSVTCEITGSFTLPCRGRKTEGVQLVTFGVYTAIRLLIGMVINIGFTLMDASLIQMVEDFNGDVGINRAFILIGYCVMPPLSGLLIDHVSAGKQDIDYSPAFYIFAVCMALAAGILSLADLRLRKPAKNIFKNARQLLRFPRVVAFLCIYGVIGMGWGYLETFLFWFLADKDDLKAPNKFLGLTNAVGAVAGLPFAVAASWIISRTGHTTIFLVGVLVMGLRFVGYSLVTNYWLVLPLEAMEAFTSTLPITAATIYASTFSAELLATLQGVISAVHFGIGRGVGSLLGGFLVDGLGSHRAAFQVMAYICFGYCFLHALLHYFYLRHLGRPNKRRQPQPTPTDPNGNIKAAMDRDNDPEELEISEKDLDGAGLRRLSFLPVFVPGDMENCGSNLALESIGLTRDRSSFLQPGEEQGALLHQRRRDAV